MTADRRPPGTGSRPRLTSDTRRDKIVAAARAVFVRHGLAGARTREFAREAGVNEALIYKHFRSKDELFEAAVVAPLEELVASLATSVGDPHEDISDETLYETTRQHMLNTIRVMDEVAPLLGVMLFAGEDKAATSYQERIAPYLAEIQRINVLNRPYWQHADYDPEFAIQAAFGVAWFRAINSRFTGQPLDFEAEAEKLTSMILDGLRLRKE